MDKSLKQRLLGAAVITTLVVIIIPELVREDSDPARVVDTPMPSAPTSSGSDVVITLPEPEPVEPPAPSPLGQGPLLSTPPPSLPNLPGDSPTPGETPSTPTTTTIPEVLDTTEAAVTDDGGPISVDEVANAITGDNALEDSEDGAEASAAEQSEAARIAAAAEARNRIAEELRPPREQSGDSTAAVAERREAERREAERREAELRATIARQQQERREAEAAAERERQARREAEAAAARTRQQQARREAEAEAAAERQRREAAAERQRREAAAREAAQTAQQPSPTPRPAPQRPAQQVAPLPSVDLISQPDPQATTPTTQASATINWTVQAGSFSSEENAGRLRQRLQGQGFPASVRQVTVGGQQLFRVFIGPQTSRNASEQVLQRLQRDAGIRGAVMPLGR